MIPGPFMDGVEAMADRIEALEAENRLLAEENQRLSRDLEICMGFFMRTKLLLDAHRRKHGAGHSGDKRTGIAG